MKNRVVIGTCLALAAMAVLLPLGPRRTVQAQSQGQGSGAPPLSNPLKVALLHWYLADESTMVNVGSEPYGLCFDGANIWTANYGDNTVTKIQANDGQVLGTFKVGTQPFGVTFDGANIWVSNQLDSTVTKLRASDGKTLGTFPVGHYPGWMAFDGQNVWVPNATDNNVTKLRAADGKNVGTFPVGTNPNAIAFDELQIALEPLLAAIESVSERIAEYNERIEKLAQQSYPQVALLKQIKGVGTLIALTFLLTLEDPHRFGKSRDVGCYLGLQPGRRNSGRREPQMHISNGTRHLPHQHHRRQKSSPISSGHAPSPACRVRTVAP